MDDIEPSLIAMVQMTSGTNADQNLAIIDAAMEEAAAAGAAMVFLPEMSLLLDRDRTRSAHVIGREDDNPWIAALTAMAQRHELWLHTGSIPLLTDDGKARFNRSHVIASDGSIRATYDKIHMFDVDLPTGERWSESASYQGGDSVVVVDTPIGLLGLTICYDLRFPELFRALVDRGAAVIAVPAAFTVPTGEAHWHILLRARAIETACHLVAAAQVGDHVDGRSTFGHSLAVDPWGAILCDGGASNVADFKLCFAKIDVTATKRARAAIPLDRSRTIRNIAL